MKEVFFGEWRDGRLKRLQFFGYSILLIVVSVAVVMGGIMLAGGFESVMSNDSNLFAGMGVVMMVALFVFIFAMLAANLNITAKRFRDMGLPGWWSVVVTIVISWILEITFPGQSVDINAQLAENEQVFAAAMEANSTSSSTVADLFSLVVFAVLVFVPSDSFGKKNSTLES